MVDLELWETRLFLDINNKIVGTTFSVDEPVTPNTGDMYSGYEVVTADLSTGSKTLFIMVK